MAATKLSPYSRPTQGGKTSTSLFATWIDLAMLRGGAKGVAAVTNAAAAAAAAASASASFNLANESYKLQSMATYSTITALIMNACLRLYTSQKFTAATATVTTAPSSSAENNDDEERSSSNTAAECLFEFLSILCIISGVFTALLFNILGIYRQVFIISFDSLVMFLVFAGTRMIRENYSKNDAPQSHSSCIISFRSHRPIILPPVNHLWVWPTGTVM